MRKEPPRIVVRLHDAQQQVWYSPARFKVVACGRRFGKTFLGVNELIRAANQPGTINWWVAPILDQTDVAFRMFKKAMPPELVSINHTKKQATLWNGSLVAFKTANDPDSLRSEGLDFVAVDEAAFAKAQVWSAVLRPALADKKGRALLIGTFDGENYFYDLYQRGQKPGGEYESWRFPSSANPFLDPAEIAEAERTTPRAEFEQEWLANPLIYVGAVFPGAEVQAAIDAGALSMWHPNRDTYAGLDWGYTNPTVLEVCQEDAEGRVDWVAERQWVATRMATRLAEIIDACRLHQIRTIYADAAGKDENVELAHALKGAGLKTVVVPVPFNRFKESGIKTRRWFIENGLERIGPACVELARTTKRYRYKEIKSKAGVIHTDDVVKEDDHPVDAATAFYASRRNAVLRDVA